MDVDVKVEDVPDVTTRVLLETVNICSFVGFCCLYMIFYDTDSGGYIRPTNQRDRDHR